MENEVEQLPEGQFVQADEELKDGEATDEPRIGHEVPLGETAQLEDE